MTDHPANVSSTTVSKSTKTTSATYHPALDAYNSATAYGQPHRLKNAVIELADAMRDEYEARIKALEAELAAERGKRCKHAGESCPFYVTAEQGAET
jgi:hypothetical protein